MPDLNAAILQDQGFISTLNNKSDTNLLNMILIPKIIKEKYPELKEDETEELRQYVICDNLFRKSNYQKGDKIVQFANETINVEDLDIDLIQKINPFLNSFQILSKQLSPRMFRAIKDYIDAFKNDMTDDEAIILWPKINEYVQKTGRLPSLNSLDPLEKRYAEALVYLRNIKRREKALNER